LLLFNCPILTSDTPPSADGEIPCIRYGELYTTYGEVIEEPVSYTNLPKSDLIFSEVDDVLIPASGETQIDIATASCVKQAGIALSGDLNILKTKLDGTWLAYSVGGPNKQRIAKMGQGNSVVHLYSSQLKAVEITYPPLPEQQKTAAFLTAVDGRLRTLRRQWELLGEYKRGVMQRVFSGELRFCDKSGNPFPEWQTMKFNEAFQRVKRKNTEDNQNVLTISAQQGLVNQEDYFNKSVSAKDVRGYYLLKRGEFAYNKSYSKGYPLGAIKRLSSYDKGVVSTLYICFGITNDQVSADFMEQFFEAGGLNHEISKIAQEGARNHGLLNVSVVEFFKDIEITFPSLPEQRRIATLLCALDDRIALVERQLDGAEAFKRGLLQKMFV
jgi:type I restriction enzyme S subunit